MHILHDKIKVQKQYFTPVEKLIDLTLLRMSCEGKGKVDLVQALNVYVAAEV